MLTALRLSVAILARAFRLVAAPSRTQQRGHRFVARFAGIATGTTVAATVPTLALSMPKPIEVSWGERPALRSRRNPTTTCSVPTLSTAPACLVLRCSLLLRERSVLQAVAHVRAVPRPQAVGDDRGVRRNLLGGWQWLGEPRARLPSAQSGRPPRQPQICQLSHLRRVFRRPFRNLWR